MFDVPVDTWYVWVGLSLVATAAAATVTGFPTAPAPDATAAAGTVERVAAVDHDATGRHPLDADAVRVTPTSISLRDDGRTSHASVHPPVTPVRRGTRLWRLLRGVRPTDAFDGPRAMERAAGSARNRSTGWRTADQLFVRTVVWRDVHVTLVGA